MKALLLTLCGLMFYMTVSGQSKTEMNKDQEMFLQTMQAFVEANELGVKVMDEFTLGEVPDMSMFIEKVNEGISTSKNVSYSYLNSKHSDLPKLFRDYVQSYELTLKVYNEIRDPDEVRKIQEDIEQKQYEFFAFLEKNQNLFDDQLQVAPIEKASSASFTDFLWFIGKVFLAIFPFILVLMLLSMILNGIAFALNRVNKLTVMIYFLMISVLYLYVYAFLGAYYHSVYTYYSMLFGKKWLIYIVCLIGIVFIYNQFSKELRLARHKLNQNHPLGSYTLKLGNNYSIEDIGLISTIYNLKGIWMIFVSFIVFTFYPQLANTLYGNLAHYFAKLWT